MHGFDRLESYIYLQENLQSMLWVEKYRPKDISEVVADKETIARVMEWAKKWQKGT